MSFLFGGGNDETPQYESTKEEEKKKIRTGKKSTILTGPLGLTDEPTVARKTLLGQ